MTQYPTYRINKSPISACKRPATTLSEFGVLFSFTIMISCEMQYDVRHTRQNSGPCLHSAALIDMALVNSKTTKKGDLSTWPYFPIDRQNGGQ